MKEKKETVSAERGTGCYKGASPPPLRRRLPPLQRDATLMCHQTVPTAKRKCIEIYQSVIFEIRRVKKGRAVIGRGSVLRPGADC